MSGDDGVMGGGKSESLNKSSGDAWASEFEGAVSVGAELLFVHLRSMHRLFLGFDELHVEQAVCERHMILCTCHDSSQ